MTEGRFVADSSLQGLARRLRALGYDVLVLEGVRLEEVCRAARLEGRTVLTTSLRVPPPCRWCERFVVARGEEDAGLRALVERYRPGGPAFGRCIRCNVPLEHTAGGSDCLGAPIAPPAGVTVTGRCPACGRCYWHGSHVERLMSWFERKLGRPVEPPGAGTPPDATRGT